MAAPAQLVKLQSAYNASSSFAREADTLQGADRQFHDRIYFIVFNRWTLPRSAQRNQPAQAFVQVVIEQPLIAFEIYGAIDEQTPEISGFAPSEADCDVDIVRFLNSPVAGTNGTNCVFRRS